jgi:hypothetical protein
MSESISRRRFLVAGASVLAVGAAALVGGTYAKYTTKDSVSDSARVAKFGVTLSSTGKLFASTYSNSQAESIGTDSWAQGKLTVVSDGNSDNKSNLIAPGTSSKEANAGTDYEGLTVSISGTPEVAVEVTVETEWTDVFLPSGVYYGTSVSDYYPLAYTVTSRSGTKSYGKLSEVAKAIATLFTAGAEASVENDVAVIGASGSRSDTALFLPSMSLAENIGDISVGWEWPIGPNDVADTVLGDVAAEVLNAPNSSTTPSFKITITVTQVD